MDANKINKEYIDLIMTNPEEYEDDYKETMEKVRTSKAQYKGEPVPTIYHPMFYTNKEMEDFKKIGDMMLSISNKISDRYIRDKEFRKKFTYPKLIEDLIEVDNGYDIHVPIGRFDIFYKDYENFKFCELNTDGSSAMNEDNVLAQIILESKGIRNLSDSYKIDYFELFHSWVRESIEIYRKFNPENPKPNVAIVDFKESGTTNEFLEFQKAYEANGYPCIIVDPRDLVYRDGKLYHEDYRIDLVYRRIVTFEIIDKADEIPDFLQAYKDRAFCSIGSIRSQIIHNKIFFKVLHEEDSLEGLNQEERDFVKKHIPHTGVFDGHEDVFKLILDNKDKYIMKPMDLNASRGVYAGRDFSQEKWEEKLRESWGNDYLFQEFVQPWTRDFLVYDEGFKVEELKTIIGLFLYNGKLQGLYTRIGPNNIISGLTDYYVLPSLKVDSQAIVEL